MSIEDVKARIDAKRAAHEARRAAQELVDLEAYEQLIDEHGYDGLAKLSFPRYIENFPTFLLVKAAPGEYVQLHRDRITKGRRQKGGQVDTAVAIKAAEEVADACVVYPDKEIYLEIRAKYPTVHADAGAAALQLARAQEEELGN